MPEYRILEKIPGPVAGMQVEEWKIIGEGFLSFNAVWLAINAEFSRRMMEGTETAELQIQRMESTVAIQVAYIRVDDRKTELMMETITR